MSLIPLGRVPRMQADRIGRNHVAIRFGDDTITWGELDCRSDQRAWAFKAAGIGKDDIVTLALPNGTAFFECIFALWRIGACPHVVSSHLPVPELRSILDVARPKMVIAQSIELQQSLGAKGADFGRDFPNFEPHPETMSSNWKAMSSGGSTGTPKIIVSPMPSGFDPERLPPLRMPKSGTILATGPLYHNMPMTTNIQALFEGLDIVGLTRFDPEEALRLIDRHKVAWTSFVPTMMMRISRLPGEVRARYDVSSLETVWHWAAPMPPDLKQEWIDWIGAEKIWEVYGGTEGLVTTIINGADWLTHRGSVGRPFLDKIRILDESGGELPPGEVGEIYGLPAGGPQSTYRYIGAEPRSAEGGYETLGDFGWLDEEGFLYIADRRTDMIVSGGANIFPAEVEGAIMAHKGVEAAVVIGLPHPDLGAAAHAIVKPAEGWTGRLDQQALADFLSDRLVRYKVPRTFEFVDDNLRDDAGKVRRQQLREQRLQAV